VPKMHRTICLLAVALAAPVILAPTVASADVFGQCAHQRDLEKKIAACTAAAKSTVYPKVLHWVYRELAGAHHARGDMEIALTNYKRSLDADDRKAVQLEMNAVFD
jgi:hypothetical protein